jgi:hypothetical protein
MYHVRSRIYFPFASANRQNSVVFGFRSLTAQDLRISPCCLLLMIFSSPFLFGRECRRLAWCFSWGLNSWHENSIEIFYKALPRFDLFFFLSHSEFLIIDSYNFTSNPFLIEPLKTYGKKQELNPSYSVEVFWLLSNNNVCVASG